jgi:hypothetical protein
MKTRVGVILFLAIAVAATFITAPRLSAQGRDGFPHGTAAHKKVNCNSCHKLPTANWTSARGYPDVADYPGHTACNSCHSGRQFLALCNSCHVSNITPRRPLRLAFPRSKTLTEFNTIFPHNVHQDIIAGRDRKDGVAVAHFVNASFRPPVADDPPKFNNCAICHETTTASPLPKLIARTPDAKTALAAAAAETFAPTAAFFRDMPSGHTTCFACHYQNVKPVATDCAGCHSLTPLYSDSNSIRRYSFKFDHQHKNHVGIDCMSCHIRIAQNADVRKMVDADVPVLTCSTSSCHGGRKADLPRDDPAYWSNVLSIEIANRQKSIENKTAPFQCTYCHTPEVGRFPIPKSHENR